LRGSRIDTVIRFAPRLASIAIVSATHLAG
jgi:hypothetical protein